MREFIGVVAQGFDLKYNAALRAVGARDSKRMRPFRAIECDKRKLPRLMPWPFLFQLARYLGDASARMGNSRDGCVEPTALADMSHEDLHACHCTRRHHGEHQQAQRFGPVLVGRHHNRMEHQRQVKEGHGSMNVTPHAVRKAFPQGDGQHDE